MKKEQYIKARVSDELLKEINSRVALTALSREEYIRCLISGYRPKEQPSKEFFEIISQLRAIGNNINQIATNANRLGYIDVEFFKEQVNFLRKEILEIRTIVCTPTKLDGNDSNMGCE